MSIKALDEVHCEEGSRIIPITYFPSWRVQINLTSLYQAELSYAGVELDGQGGTKRGMERNQEGLCPPREINPDSGN